MVGAYLPHLAQPYDDWAQVVAALRAVQKHTSKLVLAGDLNADALGCAQLGGQPRIAARFDQQWVRTEELLRLLQDFGLHMCGVATTAATHFPWHGGLAARQLDYILTTLAHRECRLEDAPGEAVMATSHIALVVAAPETSSAAAPGGKPRRAWVRRRWPHWREAVPGQLQAILPDLKGITRLCHAQKVVATPRAQCASLGQPIKVRLSTLMWPC